jgi:transposase
VAFRQTEYNWVYVFGAVCPRTGRAHGWLMPKANSETMNIYLQDLSHRIEPDRHVLLICDRAGWHRSKKLKVPENITLAYLPPYAPELNPAELLWREQRSKGLSNRVFKNTAELEDHVSRTWMQLETDATRLHSLCCFPWIRSAVFN